MQVKQPFSLSIKVAPVSKVGRKPTISSIFESFFRILKVLFLEKAPYYANTFPSHSRTRGTPSRCATVGAMSRMDAAGRATFFP